MELSANEIIGTTGIALSIVGVCFNWTKTIYARIDKLSEQIIKLSETIANLDKTVAVLSDRIDRI